MKMRSIVPLLLALTGCDIGFGQKAHVTTNDVGTGVAPCAPSHRCAVDGGPLFDGMSLFQIGPPGEIRQTACPGFAPHAGVVLYGDFGDTSYSCGTCNCGPAACALPTTMEVSPEKCPGGGAVLPFGAPDSWEGTCTDTDAPVSGGGSLTIEAPPILPCSTIEGPRVDPAPLEPALMARACIVTLERSTCGEGEVCAPELPPDDPLSLCLFRRGEDDLSLKCPAGYPRRFTMVADYVDDRGCTPCKCGASQGAECSALISIYKDGACGDFLESLAVSAPDPGCHDLPAGVSLGSKDAILTTDIPGSCAASGGMPSGDIETTGSMTLCCEAVYKAAR